MRLTYGASESCYALRSVLRRNKGQDDAHQAVVIADIKRRSPTSAELPPDVNAFDDPAAWASQVTSNSSRSTAEVCNPGDLKNLSADPPHHVSAVSTFSFP